MLQELENDKDAVRIQRKSCQKTSCQNTKISVCLLKQDKGWGIVLMDWNKYVKKCLEILQSNKFTVIQNDPTAQFETCIQKCLRKIQHTIQSTKQHHDLAVILWFIYFRGTMCLIYTQNYQSHFLVCIIIYFTTVTMQL